MHHKKRHQDNAVGHCQRSVLFPPGMHQIEEMRMLALTSGISVTTSQLLSLSLSIG